MTDLAIYHSGGGLALNQNPFGRDVANLELYRALARHGGFARLEVLTQAPTPLEALREPLVGDLAHAPPIGVASIFDQSAAARAGTVLRGRVDTHELAWVRRAAVGDAAYSLIGLIHTLAPPMVRQDLSRALVDPLRDWDAIVCTSPAVKTAAEEMFARYGEHLAEITGGRPPAPPQLPLIPLGVDAAAMAAQADRPQAAAAVRDRLGVAPGEVLVLWVGRLSFFEKAFPQPMFRAVAEAQARSGVKHHFAMAGWFPDPGHAERYRNAAAAYAPGLPVHLLDGNDRALLGELWAGADVFLSLVDNLQETFGITPLEAMAAGLPVVASDWDGYRYTMRHGVEAFLVPTLTPAAGDLGAALYRMHALRMETYQGYVGVAAAHTAVSVEAAAAALAELALRPDLRRRMGEAGRARVAEAFDWSVVARAYRELVEDLAARRAAAPPAPPRAGAINHDPFDDLRTFPTARLSPETRLILRETDIAAVQQRLAGLALDRVGAVWRANAAEVGLVLDGFAAQPRQTAAEALAALPADRRERGAWALVWLCKLGVLDFG